MRAWVALLAILSVPTAHALDFNRPATTPWLDADGTPQRVDIDVTHQCSAAWFEPPGERIYALEYAAENGLLVEGPSSFTMDGTECLFVDEIMAQITLEISAAPGAPGLEGLELTIDAHLASTDVPAPPPSQLHEATIDLHAIVEYVGDFTVEVIDKHVKTEPQESADYTLHLTNHGNTDNRIAFGLMDEDGIRIVLPPEVILAPAGKEGSTSQVVASYVAPFENGPNDHTAAFRIVATSHYALDHELVGQRHEIDLSAHTKGFYVPGPELGLLGMALLALARRR